MFSYIGGKSRIGKWIYENIPNFQYKRYTEVFGGAMWLYINQPIKAKEVCYNDLYPHLYNLWMCMKDRRSELLHELFELEPNRKELFNPFKQDVLKTGESVIESVPNVNLAKKFIYVQTHAFSGLVIQGTMRLKVDQFTPFVKRLSKEKFQDKIDSITNIYNKDFKKIIEELDIKDGFFYVDPPYYKKGYLYHNDFKDEYHQDLAYYLKNCKSIWALSYYDHEDLRKLYPGDRFIWLSKEFSKSSSRKKGKDKAKEILVLPAKVLDYENKIIEGFFK